MYVMLDCLKKETSPLKVVATSWLTHVIQQGDICRVMEPLLQMLLHPDTARYVILGDLADYHSHKAVLI